MDYLLLASKMYPNASCELNYNNPFELLIAVTLSAQTTDKAVNKVTAILFERYKTVIDLANASLLDLEEIIKPLGLSKTKSKYIKEIALKIHNDYSDLVPKDIEALKSLPGVGRKTANCVLAEAFKEPHIAVDTHVFRVSKRLGIVDEDSSFLECEKKLESLFDKKDWIKLHHTFLFLGRYTCKSQKPDCKNCLLNSGCKFLTKTR